MTTVGGSGWTEQEIDAFRNHFPADVPVIPGIDPGISQDPDLHDALLAAALPSMGTRDRMIYAAQRLLGTTEHPPGSNHNDITVFYNQHVAKIGDGARCDMSVTEEAWHSGNEVAVLGGKGFAFVPAHMDRGQLRYGIPDRGPAGRGSRRGLHRR